MELPIYGANSQKGEDGVSVVKRIVEKELKWIFRKNHAEYDFGIDAYLDIISEKSQMTGKSIAVQIKTGDSYFCETNISGWVYRDSIEHLNYYLNHDIAVLIFLVNHHTDKVYWGVCDASKTERAGNNWKITIPFNKKLNNGAKRELLQYVSPVQDYSAQLDGFWKLNEELKDAGRVLLGISEEQINKSRFDELADFFNRFSANPELVMSMRGKVDIGIDGYENDEREIYQIDTVRNWINQLFDNVNGLAYFLTKDEYAQWLKVMFFSWNEIGIISDGARIENGKPVKNVEVIRSEKTRSFFEYIFNDLNVFCDKHNISGKVNKEISKEIGMYLGFDRQ